MRFVSGSTASEKRLVCAIQKAAGAVQDNSIGPQTLTDIACLLKADCFPLSVKIFGQDVIIAEDVEIFGTKASLASCKEQFAISGTFSYQQKTCSIAVNRGDVINGYACHSWFKPPLPEAVLYRLTDGYIGVLEAKYHTELPQRVSWAIGGFGLLDHWNPTGQGFTGKYSDVMKRDNHTMIGAKHGYIYLCYCGNMTGEEVNAYAKKLGLEKAVMLDGGHIAAIRSEDVNRNIGQRQYSVVAAR